MSGIVGLLDLGGRPIDPLLLDGMLTRSLHRGPDGIGRFVDGPVGLGHLRLHTVPGDRPQPVTDADGATRLVFDGRLDNRAEIAAALGMPTDAPDAEIVLAAYVQWGGDCPGRLIGDYAFVVWDARTRTLFAARDALGVRPLYYATGGRTFACASDLAQVRLVPGLGQEPNEGMIGEYLTDLVRTPHETLYRDVYRLAPGHTLQVRDGRIRLEEYWRADPKPALRYRTEAEYAEHLRSVLGEAVACRLRATGNVAVSLSGGLDSSSVAGVASALASSRRGIEAFSLVFPEDPRSDERSYIDDVIRRWELPWQGVASGTASLHECVAQIRHREDVPDSPNDWLAGALRPCIRARGIRVVLTGAGGDLCLNGSLYHYAELLRAGRLVALARQWRDDARTPNTGWTPAALAVFGVGPLMPELIRRPASRLTDWFRPRAYPAWISPGFAARIDLQRRLWPRPRPDRPTQLVGRDVAATLSWASPLLHLEMFERGSAEQGLEDRHPFLDRRVVEFALGLPELQRWRGNETKYLLRRALADVLPESVRARRDKGDFSPVGMAALEALGGARRIDRLAIAEAGWVDQAALSAAYRRARALFEGGDPGYDRLVMRLWAAMSVDLWFRCILMREALEPDLPAGEADPVGRPAHGRSAAR